jgi:hypothetical protein
MRSPVVAFALALLAAVVPAVVAAAPAPDEFPVTLGSFTTTLVGPLPGRTHNLRLAARALDGAVLRPGEELSFNLRVGPRTAERGYGPAPVILRDTRYAQEQWPRLEADPRARHLSQDVQPVMTSPCGRKYQIRGILTGVGSRSAEVVRVWILLAGEDAPRFVTTCPGGTP